ncbi:ATP-binding protein [Streptomyces sp. NPDC051130]|uniref:ATP-binding protein n=1 Tax=Streptomyces sp. NPDC051130 TaxID=3157223 RepID=UPI003421FF99
MSIAALPIRTDLLTQVGVPHAMSVLDQAELSLERSGVPDRDAQRSRQMRRAVKAWLGIWRLRAHVDDAQLLLSELVTNAFQHGTGDVRVRLFRTEAYLCFEVRSTGPGTPTPRSADDLDESGRGLFLVEAFADRWAVSADGAGVWCTLPIDRPEITR